MDLQVLVLVLKPQKFKEYFEEEIITISLPTIPNLAIDTLEQIIEAF